MTTQLNLSYSITFKASTKVIDNQGEFSSEDLIQQQLQFSSNALINSAAKRIEISLLPSSYTTLNPLRVYDIDLDSLKVGFIRAIYIKSEKQFLYSTASTPSLLDTQDKILSQCLVLDRGVMPSPSIYVPDEIYPKYIRLINPLEINGGGTGNSIEDVPIIVSAFIICTPATPTI
jgi:hypothetical protein